MHALTLLAAYLLGVVAIARATRLVVHDPYPPMEAARLAWITWQTRRDASYDPTDHGYLHDMRHGWSALLTCPFCAAPYITAVTLTVAILGDVWTPDLGTLSGWWWVLAVWASASYLAAMVVLRDEPPADD